LSHDWTTIGRADGNAVKIPQASVSGWHCEVKLQGDELKVRDLCSTNGTLVEGRKISEAILKPGQTLRVGDVDLRFEAPAVKSAPATPFVNTMLAGAASRKPAPPPAPKPVPLPSFGGRPVTPAIPGEAAKKYQVLFVDDSREFIETFGELCCVLSNQTWKAHSAMSADQALAILEQHPVDLVVLDINMPMVDGMQLLGIIQRRHPGVLPGTGSGSVHGKTGFRRWQQGGFQHVEQRGFLGTPPGIQRHLAPGRLAGSRPDGMYRTSLRHSGSPQPANPR
jgi:CheY-like chemotaxis protein